MLHCVLRKRIKFNYELSSNVSGATTPTYDNNGNLTKDENDNRFVWDAWNREVKIKNSSNTVIATNAYNALNHKVQVTTSAGTIDEFFSNNWQVLEGKNGSNTQSRYVWSPAYVDGLVTRDRDTDANGTLDERLFALQDANWNVTGITNTSGTIQERYTETPYGIVTFRDGSGSTISVSTKGWDILHQGAKADIIGDYDFRNRVYSPTLGRWLTNDPLGFNAGDVNTFRYVGNGPGNRSDPSGLWFLIDDAFFIVGGAVVGVGGRVVGDLITGSRSPWEDYVGAGVGGAVGAEVLLYTGNPFIAGAAGGFTSNGVTQTIKIIDGSQKKFDWPSLLIDSGVGAATGILQGYPRISPINLGRGSYTQVFKQMVTRFQNGEISNGSTRTAAKMAIGAIYDNALIIGAAAGSVASSIYGRIF